MMPFVVPTICRHCRHYDDGEYGAYGGGRLSGPWCVLNVRFPTRTGFCGRHQPKGAKYPPQPHSVAAPGGALMPQAQLWRLAWHWTALLQLQGSQAHAPDRP